MSTIRLEKNDSINLTKGNGTKYIKIRIGLGWSPADRFPAYDLDASVFICKHVKTPSGYDPKLISDSHFIFYNNKVSPDGAVVHLGDNLVGGAGDKDDADDETITIDLEKVVNIATEISVIVTIHEAVHRKQHFGDVKNSYMRIYDDTNGDVIADYRLQQFTTETAIQIGSFVKDGDNWMFKAVGAGYNLSLGDLVEGYQI